MLALLGIPAGISSFGVVVSICGDDGGKSRVGDDSMGRGLERVGGDDDEIALPFPDEAAAC